MNTQSNFIHNRHKAEITHVSVNTSVSTTWGPITQQNAIQQPTGTPDRRTHINLPDVRVSGREKPHRKHTCFNPLLDEVLEQADGTDGERNSAAACRGETGDEEHKDISCAIRSTVSSRESHTGACKAGVIKDMCFSWNKNDFSEKKNIF